jgi:hypothetical protein
MGEMLVRKKFASTQGWSVNVRKPKFLQTNDIESTERTGVNVSGKVVKQRSDASVGGRSERIHVPSKDTKWTNLVLSKVVQLLPSSTEALRVVVAHCFRRFADQWAAAESSESATTGGMNLYFNFSVMWPAANAASRVILHASWLLAIKL